MTENSSTNYTTTFMSHLMTLTGCNEATAKYCAIASQGKFSRLRQVDTALLTKPQRHKVDSLNAAINSVAMEYSIDTVQISNSSDIHNLMSGRLQGLIHEEVWAIYMNNKGTVVHLEQLSKGGMTGTVVDIKIVLRVALQCAATRFILVHNHPSGSCRPSQQDMHMTRKVQSAAEGMDIKLNDHVIIAGDRYYSMLDEGTMTFAP